MQKILLISPQPFFQLRGSPIRVGFNVQALVNNGYQVDLLTLPIGEKREIEGVNMIRVANPLRLKNIVIGPSPAKILFDLLILFKGLGLILTNKYAMIHGIEETGIIAVFLARLNGAKAIFEKHSDADSHRKGFLRNCLLSCYVLVERLTVRMADGVICTGPGLMEQVNKIKRTVPAFHIPDIPSSLIGATSDKTAKIRTELQQKKSDVLICFVGSFAVYQGVELMFASVPEVVANAPQARFVIIGGSAKEILKWQNHFKKLKISNHLSFLGKIAPDTLPDYLSAADILLSPRISGVNSPLKLIDYFKAGRPVVATNIPSNMLILNKTNSVLSHPDPASFAKAIIKLVNDKETREKLGANGHYLYSTRYNFSEFQKQLKSSYEQILKPVSCACVITDQS